MFVGSPLQEIARSVLYVPPMFQLLSPLYLGWVADILPKIWQYPFLKMQLSKVTGSEGESRQSKGDRLI